MDHFVKVMKEILTSEAVSKKDQWPVHERHCCPKHGCKYGDEWCPVMLGLTDKHNEHCECCEDDYKNPDPLNILESYCNARAEKTFDTRTQLMFTAMIEVIKEVRKSPGKVAERGRIEGWFE
jgi:hypothetical protein